MRAGDDMDNLPFDRELLKRRRARAFRSSRDADFLACEVVRDMAERLSVIRRSFARAAILGPGGKHAASVLAGPEAVNPIGGEVLVQTDLLEDVAKCLTGDAVVADEEMLPFGEGTLDLVLAPLSLSFVNDLPGALVQIRRALRADGLFLGVVPGGETLKELRDVLMLVEAELYGGVSPRVAPFADVQTLGQLLLRAGFTLPVVDRDALTVRYGTVLDLIGDLRALGATNILRARRGGYLGRQFLLRLMAVYHERHGAADGRIPATFELLTMTAWAPHESQQKPLRPGSAQARLADALGTTERSFETRVASSDDPQDPDV